MEQGPPHLLCQTPALSDRSSGTKWLPGDVFRTEHTARQFLRSSLAFCEPAAPSSQTIQPFPLVKPGAKVTRCCSTGLVALDSREMTTGKARSQYLQCSVVLLQQQQGRVGILFYPPHSTTCMKVFQSLFQNK